MRPSVPINREALRATRLRRGLSQSRLADILAARTDASAWAWQARISNIERGRQAGAVEDAADALVAVLGPDVLARPAIPASDSVRSRR
jgi:transcriptional regulator with XRE-family HTH domain